jgi:bifunctional DNase/RNase
MVITRQTVRERLLAYLNQEVTLGELVDWSENTFIDDVLAPDGDVDMLNNILSYLAGADSAQFPLTWDICADFLTQLGVKVQVVLIDQAS